MYTYVYYLGSLGETAKGGAVEWLVGALEEAILDVAFLDTQATPLVHATVHEAL